VPIPGTPLFDNGQFTYNNQQLSNVLSQLTGSTATTQCGTPTDPNRPAGACTKFSPQGVQSDLKIPTVEKWSLSLEQRLTDTMSLRIGYLGSFSYHQLLSIDGNTIPAQQCLTAGGCTVLAGGVQASGLRVPSGNNVSIPYGAYYIPYASSQCVYPYPAQGCRPNPYLGAGFLWYSNGNASYNALQVELTKRFSRRLQFRANYTWSKSLDINSAPTIAQANNQPQTVLNPSNPHMDWGPSALNTTHQAHITVTYQLPFGHGQYWGANVKGVADKLLSGWTLNSIATFLSGFPLTPRVGSNVSGNGDVRSPDRPDLVPGIPQYVRSGTQWLNSAAYTPPANGTFGNLGRGTLTGPGLTEVDISLSKETQLSDRVAMQFRTECFNVLNHNNFGLPNLVLSSGSFGAVSNTATSSRQIQFGIKLIM